MSQLASRPIGGVITDAEPGPLITAVLVTRNKEAYLRECLCGIMEQSVADRMEVIVVDLGSEQSECSVVADLQRRYSNLVYLRTAAAKGVCAGLNLAFRIASGNYLTVIEATDRLRGDAYELLSTTLEADPEAMLAYGDTCFTAIPHETFTDHTNYGKMIWPDYAIPQLTQLPAIAPHPMWRRELSGSIGGFDESYQYQGMRDFLLRAAGRFRMVHVEEFTGLTLVAAGAPLDQDISERELTSLRERYRGAPRQPSLPAPAPALSADEAYAQIQALVHGGSDSEGARALVRHLERYPEHSLAHNDLAVLSSRLGDPATAIRHYRSAVRFAPKEALYRKNLADQLFVAGEIDEAVAIYLELLASSPRDTDTLLGLGIMSDQLGQPGEAEIFIQRGLEIEPWHPGLRERLTELRRKALQPPPVEEKSGEERYERATELICRGDLGAGVRELEGILTDAPDFAPAHNDLAVIHYQRGAKEEALSHYRQAVALAPCNSTFQKNLADFNFVERRDVDGAVAFYLELLRNEPKNTETLVHLGRISAQLNRPQEAETFFERAVQLEPWNRDARDELNQLHYCVNG